MTLSPARKPRRSTTATLERVSPRPASALELALIAQIRAAGLPDPILEHRFHPVRRWRFDFAWIAQRLVLEVEGGTWNGGRHTRGVGFEADCEKYNTATLMGWRVLRVTGAHIRRGDALLWLEQALNADREP